MSNNNKGKNGKITLGMLKGKPVTTSVPSIAIKFHANAEELEDIYPENDEQSTSDNDKLPTTTTATNEQENSPLRYLPRLVKRSTSIDISSGSNTTLDASPPSSDPWKFFSDIRGKITKSVEDKITEIKSRNQDDNTSPSHKLINKKDIKENSSSLSDSEDISESSISKTCGIVSTTEGAEMSSDDDDEDDNVVDYDDVEDNKQSINLDNSGRVGLRQRYRLFKNKEVIKEGTIGQKMLKNLYKINDQTLSSHTSTAINSFDDDDDDIESAVEALEMQSDNDNTSEMIKTITKQYSNIELDDNNILNIKEMNGDEIKNNLKTNIEQIFYSPKGFVDLRDKNFIIKNFSLINDIRLIFIIILIVSYFMILNYSNYLAGIIFGIFLTLIYNLIGNLFSSTDNINDKKEIDGKDMKNIVKIPSIKEHQPIIKYEGWMNELPETYNPYTYHISQTQTIYLKLQGNFLRISHTKSKVPKHAIWNEPNIKPIFTQHRIYNLLDAKVTLLPIGLAKKRHWSRKYPICIVLNDNNNLNLNEQTNLIMNDELLDDEKNLNDKSKLIKTKLKKPFNFRKKKNTILSQTFSKLTEEDEEYELESDLSRPSTPSPDLSDDQLIENNKQQINDDNNENDEEEQLLLVEDEIEIDSTSNNLLLLENCDNNNLIKTDNDNEDVTKLYIFARTDREKEDWYRKLIAATHNQEINIINNETINDDNNLLEIEHEYLKLMQNFCKLIKTNPNSSSIDESDSTTTTKLFWLNSLINRILFDCLRDPNFTLRIKERIQRKLDVIKLPYFIEELLLTELSLGDTYPLIEHITKPIINDKGLWIDFNVNYNNGLIRLILQTKLNLMKLKQPHTTDKSQVEERPAMFNSDIDDSAESSTDDEVSANLLQNSATLDLSNISTSTTTPSSNSSSSSNTSKKFIKMVDKIAESKFFQAATEYRYIKRAMEGVSKTELRLKVDIKSLIGTLVINIPGPPSDRIWLGFRPTPNLILTAHPIVGDINITYNHVISWIEKKLLKEFQKVMVLPNMEDLIIPVMCPKLPE